MTPKATRKLLVSEKIDREMTLTVEDGREVGEDNATMAIDQEADRDGSKLEHYCGYLNNVECMLLEGDCRVHEVHRAATERFEEILRENGITVIEDL